MTGRVPSYVYFIAPIGGGRIKIGCSTAPAKRLLALATWSPVPLEILASAQGTFQYELHIHTLFQHAHSHREWFNPCPEIWRLINEVRETGALPAYAIPTGRVRNPNAARHKPSDVRTPEWRAAHGMSVKDGWAKRRARLAAEVAGHDAVVSPSHPEGRAA